MSEQVFKACKELIDDAKMSCADLVFKEICLEVLYKARQVLPDKQYGQLVAYASEKMTFQIQPELIIQR
jgi:hypothetical protein